MDGKGAMKIVPNGQFVTKRDYKTLEAEVERLKIELTASYLRMEILKEEQNGLQRA